MLVAGFGWLEYLGYSFDMQAPAGRHPIQDLDDGWRRRLAHGDIDTVELGEVDEASEHTTLGDAIRGIGQVRVRLADGRVELAPLSVRDQRWFAQRPPAPFYLRRWMAYRLKRWYTFETAPPQWWVDRAERDVELVRQHSDDGIEGLRLYAERELLRGEWRLEHPAVRGVLISPSGDRIDLSTMDRKAVTAILPTQSATAAG